MQTPPRGTCLLLVAKLDPPDSESRRGSLRAGAAAGSARATGRGSVIIVRGQHVMVLALHPPGPARGALGLKTAGPGPDFHWQVAVPRQGESRTGGSTVFPPVLLRARNSQHKVKERHQTPAQAGGCQRPALCDGVYVR